MQQDIIIENIVSTVKAIQLSLISLRKQGQQESNEFNLLKKEKGTILSQLTWSEKYFNGIFGGDKDKINRLRIINNKQAFIKKKLREIDKKLKIESEKLHHQVIDYLSKNSASYQKLVREKDYHVDLYNSTLTFYNFILKAKKGVKDALVFTSWNGLLNHPQAKEELDKFKSKTAEFQHKISMYNKMLGTNLLNDKPLEGFIKFSSQSVAMDSFNKLGSTIGEIINFAENMIEENKKQVEIIITGIEKAILKDQ